MSRTTAEPTPGRRLPVGLLRDLIDDAAVFPPGCAALPDAVADYRRRQRSPLADYIGPLLVPVSMAEELATLVATGAHDGEALPVTLIARPGVEPGTLGAALEVLGADQSPASTQGLGANQRHASTQGLGADQGPASREALGADQGPASTDDLGGEHRLEGRPGLGGRLRVVGVELAHQEGWRAAGPDLPAAVEVPRGSAGHAALTELARPAVARVGDARAGTVRAVRAKLRTQSTATDPVPTAEELADFIGTCVRLGLDFKLTGGLHHGLAHTAAIDATRTEEQHGVLNVLLATHRALTGADDADLVEALNIRDAAGVAGPLLELTEDQVTALRARFTAFGCCTVTDPLTDLADLDLVDLH